jgi:hypothetical protein
MNGYVQFAVVSNAGGKPAAVAASELSKRLAMTGANHGIEFVALKRHDEFVAIMAGGDVEYVVFRWEFQLPGMVSRSFAAWEAAFLYDEDDGKAIESIVVADAIRTLEVWPGGPHEHSMRLNRIEGCPF